MNGVPPRPGLVDGKVPWYYSNVSLFMAFLSVGPLMLPMVWLHPKFSPMTKVVLTNVIMVATLVLLAVTYFVGKALFSMLPQVDPSVMMMLDQGH